MPLQDTYHQIPLNQIIINRGDRQRREINVDDLLPSILRYGVRSPILVEKIEDSGFYLLIFGERRFTASKELNLATIPARIASELSPRDRKIIELEENVHRKDLSWKDFVSAVQQIHSLHTQDDPEWTQASTAEVISLSKDSVSKLLRVAIDLADPRVQACTGWGPAWNLLARRDGRAVDDIFNELMEEPEAPSEIDSPAIGSISRPPENSSVTLDQNHYHKPSIFQADFIKWIEAYTGPPFTFIHCDFPYGIEHQRSEQGRSAEWGGYEDSSSTYWELLETLVNYQSKIFAPKSHLMFWISSDISTIQQTLSYLEDGISELDFIMRPLIWLKSDGRGIINDPNRGPRHVYETAIIANRGDRFVIAPVADAYAAPCGDKAHQSEKPEPVLRHFFRMFVDENCRFLDPTCGSGSSVCAADSLRAKSVTGIELNQEWAEIAEQRLRKSRNIRFYRGELDSEGPHT